MKRKEEREVGGMKRLERSWTVETARKAALKHGDVKETRNKQDQEVVKKTEIKPVKAHRQWNLHLVPVFLRLCLDYNMIDQMKMFFLIYIYHVYVNDDTYYIRNNEVLSDKVALDNWLKSSVLNLKFLILLKSKAWMYFLLTEAFSEMNYCYTLAVPVFFVSIVFLKVIFSAASHFVTSSFSFILSKPFLLISVTGRTEVNVARFGTNSLYSILFNST